MQVKLYSYPGSNRLKKADDFSSVFLFRKVLHGNYVKIHYKPNDLGSSRLGLVVSKMIHKKANKRNYMKRVLRELFRHEKVSWENFDIIIRVKKLFIHDNYAEIKAEVLRLTRILRHKIATAPEIPLEVAT